MPNSIGPDPVSFRACRASGPAPFQASGQPGEHRILIEQLGFEAYEEIIKLVTAAQITKAAASADPEKRGEFAIRLTSE